MIAVYIASPYTQGDVAVNVRESIKVADMLAEQGYLPYAPLLSHFLHYLEPHPKEFWMQLDLGWLERCDCVLRLPGESAGADKEVAHAARHIMPVYYSVESLVENLPADTPVNIDKAYRRVFEMAAAEIRGSLREDMAENT